MKRIVVLMFVALVLTFATVGLASADGGPHGGYTPTTDACAGCHRAHTAQAPKLLMVPEDALCLSCHGATATGADTNVEDGVYLDRDGNTESPPEGNVNRGLKGGGFVNTHMNTDFSVSPTFPISVTSHHNYDGSTGTIWGNGPITGTVYPGKPNVSMSCTNCHDPHGNGNYRILKPLPVSSGSTVTVTVTDETTKSYTVSYANGQYFGVGYEAAMASGLTRDRMSQQYQDVSGWCAQCHTRYLAQYGSSTPGGDPPPGSNPSGDPLFAYRHMAGDRAHGPCDRCHIGSPGAGVVFVTYNDKYWNHDVECMTCHVAHGTSADMTTDGPFSGSVPWPDGSTSPNGDARSSLLRVDGRGVCQACHNKQPDPATGPTP